MGGHPRTALVRAVVAAVVGGIVVASASFLIPGRYESTAVAQLALSGSSSSPVSQSVSASNDLAAQYAQVINSAPKSGDESVTATVLANQNLIQVSGQADSPAAAKAAASSAVKTLQDGVKASQAEARKSYQANLSAVTDTLDDDIKEARERVDAASRRAEAGDAEAGSPRLVELSNANDQLNSLLNQKATLRSQAALDGQVSTPTLQVIRAASSGTKVSPRPVLYGAAGGVLVGLAVFVLWRGPRRNRQHSDFLY